MSKLSVLRREIRAGIASINRQMPGVSRIQLIEAQLDANLPGLIIIARTNAELTAAIRQARGYQYPMGLFACAAPLSLVAIKALGERTACMFPSELVSCIFTGADEIEKLGATIDPHRHTLTVPIVELTAIAENLRKNPGTSRLHPWVAMLVEHMQPIGPGGPPWVRFLFVPEGDNVPVYTIEQAIRLSLGWNFTRQYIEPRIAEEVVNVQGWCRTAETVWRAPQ